MFDRFGRVKCLSCGENLKVSYIEAVPEGKKIYFRCETCGHEQEFRLAQRKAQDARKDELPCFKL
jgi:uncharacterized Zn finger protein